MLYEELRALTNNHCTYEEYENINRVYMTCDSMTKEQAANLWENSYGIERKNRLMTQLILKANNPDKSPEDISNMYSEYRSLFDKALTKQSLTYKDESSGLEFSVFKLSDKFMGLGVVTNSGEVIGTGFVERVAQ